MGKWKDDERTEKKLEKIASITLDVITAEIASGIAHVCVKLQDQVPT